MTVGDEARIAVLESNQSNMTETLKRIETKVDKLDGKVDWLDTKFATKDDHKQNKERIEKLEAIVNKVVWIVIGAVLVASLSLVLVKTWTPLKI